MKNVTVRKKVISIFSVILLIVSYIKIRGEYLEKLGLGEVFARIYLENINTTLALGFGIFIFIYLYIYIVNKGIKKGVKPFFEEEKKEMPKLLNKSISFVVAVIGSIVITTLIQGNLQLFLSNISFDIVDPVFNLDISYYMFQKPLIEKILYILLITSITTVIYTVFYYIIVLNRYFDGVEAAMIKKSPLLKKVYQNISIVSILIAILIIINNQSMVFRKNVHNKWRSRCCRCRSYRGNC